MFRLHRVLLLSLLIATLVLVSSAYAADFTNVTYHRCYDGDTCTFTLPGIHPLHKNAMRSRMTCSPQQVVRQ